MSEQKPPIPNCIDEVRIDIARLYERQSAAHSALDIQSRENERRLDELNHVKRDYLPREVYDKQHEALLSRLAILERQSSSQQGGFSAINWLIGLVVAAVAVGTVLFIKNP